MNEGMWLESAKGNIDGVLKISAMLLGYIADGAILIPAYLIEKMHDGIVYMTNEELKAYKFLIDPANKGKTLEVDYYIYLTLVDLLSY